MGDQQLTEHLCAQGASHPPTLMRMSRPPSQVFSPRDQGLVAVSGVAAVSQRVRPGSLPCCHPHSGTPPKCLCWVTSLSPWTTRPRLLLNVSCYWATHWRQPDTSSAKSHAGQSGLHLPTPETTGQRLRKDPNQHLGQRWLWVPLPETSLGPGLLHGEMLSLPGQAI